MTASDLEFYLLKADPAARHGWRRYLERDTAGYVVGTAYDPEDMLPLLLFAGLLDHAPALMAVLNPTVNAYKRLGSPASLTPSTACWGYDNRLAFARIPPERGPGTRIEVRIGDGASNPYLAVAALLAAGLDGMERELALPAPHTGGAGGDGTPLPSSFRAALAALGDDKALRAALGARFTEVFTLLKGQEIDRFERAVTDWEVDEYSWML